VRFQHGGYVGLFVHRVGLPILDRRCVMLAGLAYGTVFQRSVLCGVHESFKEI